MKNSLINRDYLRTWYNVPALLLTAFIIVKVADAVVVRRNRKEAEKWYAGLKERVRDRG